MAAIPSTSDALALLPSTVTTSSCWPTSFLDKGAKWLKDHPYITIALIIIVAAIVIGTFSAPDVSFFAKLLVGAVGAVVLLISVPIALKWKKENYPVELSEAAKLEQKSLVNAALNLVKNPKEIGWHRSYVIKALFDKEEKFKALPELTLENLTTRRVNLELLPSEVSRPIMRGEFPNDTGDPLMTCEFIVFKIRDKGPKKDELVLTIYPKEFANFHPAPQWMHVGGFAFFEDKSNRYYSFVTDGPGEKYYEKHPHLLELRKLIDGKHPTYELVP